MKFKAAIFDMDGLLLDTERVCMQVFQQACDEVQVPFDKTIYLSIIGRNATGIEHILRNYYRDNYPAVHQAWRERYNAIVLHQAIPVKDGVIELLDWLKANNIPAAVATSTKKEVAGTKLKLARLDHYFDHFTTGCEVEHGKPAPDIYLLAAERLGIAPEHCLAFEDSNNGVRAAVSANMITFQIPDLTEPDAEILALGHHVSPSLHQVLARLQQQG
ncbi:HAD family phosphatase [Motilimonas cestriensis]|uniref:HAD family phosphatase n=1 Tax=Motilimonas cestriensis TaxID=2742685 RepID=A0ABS8WCW8_9GAMM|nr:HAD family phosphatase [Motilimonas cestriensis]MCE2596398.1 HAD family phosphatase [Motilimonas cestriensis]